jgi:hypothetical protein
MFRATVISSMMALIAGVGVPSASGQGKLPKGAAGAADVKKLQAEIDKLRADLEAALRDIRDLKEALAGKIAARPDDGPLYQGRSAARWLEQYKDADPKFREEAVKALGILAKQKPDLAPALIAALKNDESALVRNYTETALAGIGEKIVPNMIALMKDKDSPKGRQGAAGVLAKLGPAAKDAVPFLIEGLKDQDAAMRYRSVLALTTIGPAAKPAIPALIDLFETSFVEAKVAMAAKKPPPRVAITTPGGKFGEVNVSSHLGRSSLTWRAVDALQSIDPDPQGILPKRLETLDRKIVGIPIAGGKDGSPFEDRNAAAEAANLPIFEEIWTALRQRYPREKK